MDKGDFSHSVFKASRFQGGSYCYANFSGSRWEDCRITGGYYTNASFSENRWKRLTFAQANLIGADFFKTPLKGMDLSTCEIAGIMVSDHYGELKGLKINPLQAADIVRMLGVKLV